jgi:hypothetical protein
MHCHAGEASAGFVPARMLRLEVQILYRAMLLQQPTDQISGGFAQRPFSFPHKSFPFRIHELGHAFGRAA